MPAGVKPPGASVFTEVIMEIPENILEQIENLSEEEILVIVINHYDETPDG